MSDKNNKPTHRAYAVKKSGDKSRWIEIGALWPHQDGKGFSLKLDAFPAPGSDIAIRQIEPGEDTASDELAELAGEKGGAK